MTKPQNRSNGRIEIDGGRGEGGGQVLRSALALSLCTGRAFRIRRIRSGRRKPGLLRQHLTAVRAAAEIAGARVSGDAIGSQTLDFVPGTVRPGDYRFAIGTAGSTTLVLQTVLYPLLLAGGRSRLVLSGGTHNPGAPPADFLLRTLLPLLNRMGPRVTIAVERHGFYPAGGGQLTVAIEPVSRLQGFSLLERGPIVTRTATAVIAGLPGHIAQRELRRVGDCLAWPDECLAHRTLPAEQGPGNVLLLGLASEQVDELFTGFGRVGVAAERVADETIAVVQRYLAANVPVAEHLADQLLLPLALAGEGEFSTLVPSRHTLTQIEVIRMFLPVEISAIERAPDVWVLRVESR